MDTSNATGRPHPEADVSRIRLVFPLALFVGPFCAFAGSALSEIVPLWSPVAPNSGSEHEATLTVYRPARPNGAAIVICPGGGYGMRTVGPEGNSIAEWLNRHGITAAVLSYRLPNGRPSIPMQDAGQAIRLMRSRAQGWGLDRRRIGILGFSAGGHLAASVATLHESVRTGSGGAMEQLSSRPDFAILIYPVISMRDVLTHRESRINLLGPEPGADLIQSYSTELHVDKKTPPTYLAHAVDDRLVPIGNSRAYAQAMRAHGNAKNVEVLELSSGGHGLNGYQGPSWEAWQRGSLEWMARRKIIPTTAATTRHP